MRRWSALLLVGCLVWLAAACRAGAGDTGAFADALLRAQGGGTAVEIETLAGKLPVGLEAALNPGRAPGAQEPPTVLPVPPQSKLQASSRVARPDGSMTFLVAYEVKSDERTVADAMRGLVDETPWHVVRGRAGAGASLFDFEHTRTGTIAGAVVVQQQPTTKAFELVVARAGKDHTLKVRRLAFVPVLGAELEDRDGGLYAARVVPGEAATSGLQEGDRIVRIGGRDVTDTASMQRALHALEDGRQPRTSVVLVVTVTPERPLETAFAMPEVRSLPKGFPAPFLLLDGLAPVAVEWSTEAAGSRYDVTMLSPRTPSDLASALRQALQRQGLRIVTDSAQGFGAALTFGSPDGTLTGTLTVDVFPGDDTYTVVRTQLQVPRQPSGGLTPRPAATPPAAATATPSATPAR